MKPNRNTWNFLRSIARSAAVLGLCFSIPACGEKEKEKRKERSESEAAPKATPGNAEPDLLKEKVAFQEKVAAAVRASRDGNTQAAVDRFKLLAAEAEMLKLPPQDLAKPIAELGGIYLNARKYEEAEPLFIQAMELIEKSIGKENVQYAKAENNLGLCYFRTGKTDLAESLFSQSIAIYETHGDPNDGAIATPINNLAGLYKYTKRYTLAEGLYKRSVNIKLALYGVESPSTALGYHNLGQLCETQGRFAEAESYYKKAVKTWLGPKNPQGQFVREGRENLAAFFRRRGREPEALRVESGGPIEDLLNQDPQTSGTLTVEEKPAAESLPSFGSSLEVQEVGAPILAPLPAKP